MCAALEVSSMCFPCRDFHFQPYEDDMLKMIIQKRLTDPRVVPEATISHAIFRVSLTLTHFGDTRQALSCILIIPTCCLTMLTLHCHADSASLVHRPKVTVLCADGILCCHKWQCFLLQMKVHGKSNVRNILDTLCKAAQAALSQQAQANSDSAGNSQASGQH